MPRLATGAHSCSAAVLPMRTMSSPKGVQKQSHACFCQGCQSTNHTPRNPPEPSGSCIRNLHQHTSEPCGTFRNLPPEPTPAHTATLRNLPEPDSGTYTSTHTPEPSGTFRTLLPEPTPTTHRKPPEPSGPCFRNLHQPHTGSLRNLPEPASGTYTSTHPKPPEPSGTCLRNLHQHTPEASGTFRNLPPEPSGTCLRNLHQHTPEPSGTFRNLPPEPTPAHTGTLRNLPEPSSGTCSCDPHRHTPELIWAEDPISLRCWGKIKNNSKQHPTGAKGVWVLKIRAKSWTVHRLQRKAHCRKKKCAEKTSLLSVFLYFLKQVVQHPEPYCRRWSGWQFVEK